MKAHEIRERFLRFFSARGHEMVPSSSLVPEDDPTLLFTNAGMVQFKRVFLGQERRPYVRAASSQKCLRAGGKHNDLEEVGRTARHHTFFEMLGNFSFGDYFKREAVEYAWTFLTEDLGLDSARMVATVHHSDDEAAALWQEVAGLPPNRIFRLGDEANFWQMADTGPCGPCSEIHYDMRPAPTRSGPRSLEEFVALGEEGSFLELWNLVFMQFDRDTEGKLHPLPAPSIDTGAGLERIASVMQEVDSNYHTDLFLPLLDRVGEVVGRPYIPASREGMSFRVLADHARAVGFLLADGVFPSNEGRGYVLRRILRRAVRHAWLLGRRDPTLVQVVDALVGIMGSTYPELKIRRDHLLRTTELEESRFLATIEGGMARFEELAPALSEGSGEGEGAERGGGAPSIISGEEAFRLYDTYGFPLDLTELMARERGYRVDVEGFERALEAQRARSRADRAQAELSVGAGETLEGWLSFAPLTQRFVGYEHREVETVVLALRHDPHWPALLLKENPFYVEAGGQVSDRGEVRGEGWRIEVQEVRRVEGWVVVAGPVREGVVPAASLAPLPVRAGVAADLRHDTERNHTATHLLHAALRRVLGGHVVQRGSLVAPDRLRFDFAHPAPLSAGERRAVEELVNQAIWHDHPVHIHHLPFGEAVRRGAMALFGEKYGEEVRVVEVPGVSLELCGGTHCRRSGEIGLFRIVSESGIAAGVRRLEAVTGPGAYRYMLEAEERLQEVAGLLKSRPENLVARTRQLLQEKEELEALLEELRRRGGGGEEVVVEARLDGEDGEIGVWGIRMKARGPEDVRAWGDGFRAGGPRRVALVAAELPDDRYALFAFVTDDLVREGIRADRLVQEVAGVVEGKGGGRAHMAQAGVGAPHRLEEALMAARAAVEKLRGGRL